MKRPIAQVAKVIASLILLAPPAQGAVTFSAGSAATLPGGNVAVPITVSGFANVLGFQFTLEWDPGVIQFSSVSGLGLPNFVYLDPDLLDSDNFGTQSVSAGRLTVLWENASPQSLNDGTSILTLNYTALGVMGSQSSILFSDNPTPRQVTVAGIPSPIDDTFISSQGSVSVVPEPVNTALGVFAGLFAGTKTLRWFLRKRSVRSAASS